MTSESTPTASSIETIVSQFETNVQRVQERSHEQLEANFTHAMNAVTDYYVYEKAPGHFQRL